MKIILSILIFVAIVYLWGRTLSAHQDLRVEIKINAPIERVWEVMTNWSEQPEWRNDLNRVEIVYNTHFIEYPKKGGAIHFTILNRVRPTNLELRLSGPVQGTYTVVLSENSTGTMIEESYALTYPSVMARILAKLFFNLEAFTHQYIDNLAKEVEKGASQFGSK
ncbi:MAG: SRPBCC family protein [Hormoscilla sp. GM102CHS1]|nr:SRPBCC family protein [Hormoscilla sp. GM102CHS1]